FDMDGEVFIAITLPEKAANVIIRPLRHEITPQVAGKKIGFTISEPGQYSVEYNNTNRPVNTVLIFANEIEDFGEIEDDPNTVVYEAGIHQDDFGRVYQVTNGQTMYLKPGAVIRGAVEMNNNSKIVGRGIIDGSYLEDHIRGIDEVCLPIETFNRSNIEIRGITIFDSNAWGIQLQNTSNVLIDNLKMVNSRCNSDGISIQSSDNITIQNSFLRTWDDSVVLKNYGQRDTHTVSVKNCVLWTDLAQTMEIGVETNKGRKDDPQIYNAEFEDILILHAMHKAPISIHNGDNAEIYDITFKNLTIEDYQAGSGDGWNYLIDITNLTGSAMGGSASWTTVQERGSIHDVLFENVHVLSGKTPGARFNSREGGSIYDVTVKDIYYGEVKLDFSDKVASDYVFITFE
ncbi:MAG: glycoside hydrolase family 28 protein, partial [Treponema sp.]|nr:glycoside hydrolase family 28 protein [Treponema sp.]